MKPRNWISAALAAICSILPGCDSFALKDIRPGVTTAVEVRAKLGNPGYEFRNEDGSVTFRNSSTAASYPWIWQCVRDDALSPDLVPTQCR